MSSDSNQFDKYKDIFPLLVATKNATYIPTQAAVQASDEKILEINANFERDEAIKSTARSAAQLQENVEIETKERKLADKENRSYTDKWNKITLTISIVAASIGLAALIVAILK